jgi:2-polyprenyl-3-methyl-5-hydroxy-6-metoxy-1,4-benzoquinol methylase
MSRSYEKYSFVAVTKGLVAGGVLLLLAWQQAQIAQLHADVRQLSSHATPSPEADHSFIEHRRLVEFDINSISPPSQKGIKPEKIIQNRQYGGKGDKPHLGGFTYKIDTDGVSTNLWRFIIGQLAVRSLVDLGCGMGVSSSFFLSQGVDVLCVEGSSDAISRSRMPKDRIVEHDFSLGPWWPSATYDAVWSVEFVEHVGRQYMDNYMPIFKKAALVFVTSSGNGGWHHVEVHEKWWWRARMAAEGFVFLNDLTKQVRQTAAARGVHYNDTALHLVHGMDVFVNPRVASLPQHRHLFGGKGCFGDAVDNQNGGRACLGVDALPSSYESLLDCTRTRPPSSPKSTKYVNFAWDCQRNPRHVS